MNICSTTLTEGESPTLQSRLNNTEQDYIKTVLIPAVWKRKCWIFGGTFAAGLVGCLMGFLQPVRFTYSTSVQLGTNGGIPWENVKDIQDHLNSEAYITEILQNSDSSAKGGHRDNRIGVSLIPLNDSSFRFTTTAASNDRALALSQMITKSLLDRDDALYQGNIRRVHQIINIFKQDIKILRQRQNPKLTRQRGFSDSHTRLVLTFVADQQRIRKDEQQIKELQWSIRNDKVRPASIIGADPVHEPVHAAGALAARVALLTLVLLTTLAILVPTPQDYHRPPASKH